ncbi:hypothetical protein GGI25_004941 [Coemansia spiralis]|uniref:DUF3752 domain-containing protein n=2 Tax=Coemansia TaxID=4863 RepID=A0A9W8G5P6_9FUNG|nr:hypothetical protein EDC05_005168 [Coemansia umbellata]KAJ2622444.1 hypothetical protein GGI26_003307 [Coemansia sp. RSA 1358]KAJ2672898.1 hypothetical protein GGI25_004941 [Coemansia spiralis]
MAGGIGPQLPPDIAAKLGIASSRPDSESENESPVIGPTMPETQPDSESRVIGPTMPGVQSDSEDDMVGPSVALAGCTQAQALEQTLDTMNSRKPSIPTSKREEWMLVPPSENNKRKIFDKSWTETPAEKKARDKKKQKKKTEAAKEPKEDETTRWVDEYNRVQRPKSLLEMHMEGQTKRNKRKKSDRKQKEVLNTMDFLSDKYAPGKDSSFM